MKTVITAVLLLLSLWQIGSGSYIYLKAVAAQLLIKQAWQQTLAGERAVKPWSWADTWPVSRLLVPKLNVNLYVLQGSAGRTLAFGPGHMVNTPLPGEDGNSVIGGHRDTHFRFLQDLAIGDKIMVQTSSGEQIEYEVSDRSIVDQQNTDVLLNEDNRLTLVTCYPFDAIVPGGPLRFVVAAKAVNVI